MGYPIQLVKLERKRVLVAGAGTVAAGKIQGLLEVGARIHVVAPEIGEAFAPWLPRLDRFDRRAARPEDVDGAALVIAATSDRRTNRMLAEAAEARGLLVNAVDDPEACTFYAPAVVRRGPVTIAISTDGASPLLAAQLRRVLEAALPRSLETVGALLARLRGRGLKGLNRRSRLLAALADPAVGRLVDRGETELAEARLTALAGAPEEPFEPGTVVIAGAGPGSKGLLTLRALDRIQRADVILHDALVDPEVLALALPGTRLVHAGRRAEQFCAGVKQTSEAMTIALMIREARAGLRVVRLHAGDPFVFGRGGEETDALDAAGVPWEAVPGISAALAAPVAAGVPLTQRGLARGFSVRTGHSATGATRGELPRDQETVVVLMGLSGVREVMAGLVAEGRPPDTPAAVVSHATRPTQRIVTGTLGTLADRIEAESIDSPATLIVGAVVARCAAGAAKAVGGVPANPSTFNEDAA